MGEVVRPGKERLAFRHLPASGQPPSYRTALSWMGVSASVFASTSIHAHWRRGNRRADVDLFKFHAAKTTRTVVRRASGGHSRNHGLDSDHPLAASLCRVTDNSG